MLLMTPALSVSSAIGATYWMSSVLPATPMRSRGESSSAVFSAALIASWYFGYPSSIMAIEPDMSATMRIVVLG